MLQIIQKGKGVKDMEKIVEEVFWDWLQHASTVLQTKLLENFDKEEDNRGAPWDSLKKSTQRYRKWSGYPASNPILNMTGKLRAGLQVMFDKTTWDLWTKTSAKQSPWLEAGFVGKRGGGTVDVTPRIHTDFPKEMYNLSTFETLTNQSKFIDILKKRLNSEFYEPGYGL